MLKTTYCEGTQRWSRGDALHAAHVREPVLIVIPPSIGQVDPTHKGHRLVDDDKFLMMSPQIDSGRHVIWVSHHLGSKKQTTRNMLLKMFFILYNKIGQFSPPK